MLTLARALKLLRTLSHGVLAAALALAATSAVLADKLHLKDGRVLEGTFVREGRGIVFFRITVGNVPQDQWFARDQVIKVEKDDPMSGQAPVMPGREEVRWSAPRGEGPHDRQGVPTRVAILNFGLPGERLGSVGDMVGVHITVEAFRDALPKLKEQKVDVVVIRVNSGGGYLAEVPKFNELFQSRYKASFRTVAWIESAISAAAMSPWVIEEMYFTPGGAIGSCMGCGGRRPQTQGVDPAQHLLRLEAASVQGGKDPKIMRSFELMEPLSYDIDATGKTAWRQDALGQIVLNLPGRVYTMSAGEAVASGVARGIAVTKEELVKAMGLQEVEWVGQDISKAIEDNIRENDRIERRNSEIFARYQTAIELASGLRDKQRRAQQIAIARNAFEEIRRFLQANQNFQFHFGVNLSPEWFQAQ
ncbi:MAG: hypothetical protein K2Q20_10970, partial [Phycisphaerales bacterium]|nr:hypothetical protein [Phycisphaerales bacterium]